MAGIGAVVLFAQERDGLGGRPVHFPVPPTQTPLTELEKEDAVSIVEGPGIVKHINGGEDWTADGIYRHKIAGTEAISFTAYWDTTVVNPNWAGCASSSGTGRKGPVISCHSTLRENCRGCGKSKPTLMAVPPIRSGSYPPIAAIRRTIQVIYALRVILRRRAALSINSATSSSSVNPARTLLLKAGSGVWTPAGSLWVFRRLGKGLGKQVLRRLSRSRLRSPEAHPRRSGGPDLRCVPWRRRPGCLERRHHGLLRRRLAVPGIESRCPSYSSQPAFFAIVPAIPVDSTRWRGKVTIPLMCGCLLMSCSPNPSGSLPPRADSGNLPTRLSGYAFTFALTLLCA